MVENNSSFSEIRKIDNRPKHISWATVAVLIILITVLVLFFQGKLFVFYASIFFGFYDLTQKAWLSILLVGLTQTIIFLPFRVINAFLKPDFKEFEDELEKTKSENQYILFQEKLRQGSISVIFYMLNFVLLALAFFSVGRVFLLDFYNHPISKHYLYSFIPYPEYPIQGTIFNFPFVKITSTYALNWETIFSVWGTILLFAVSLRLIWLILRRFLSKNQSILHLRINYNRLLFWGSGFAGTLFIASLFFFRHIPTSAQIIILSADLAKQNTGFNIITAICTFIASIHSGYYHHRAAAQTAQKNGIPIEIIKKVFKNNMGISIRNGCLLSLFAFWVTHLMPCSHDLSVLSFEFLYLISPFTFDQLLPKHQK